MILATHGIVGSQILKASTLLDLYPNAAAAYSLRLLRVGYTGSAIRVRRTNLDEMDIGFTSTGELDTTALLSFTGTGALDNGFVTTWYDQSGNGLNALQGTALNQPRIVNSGSIINNINGLPSIQFDGVNDNLVSSSFTSQSQPYTIFMVQKWIGSTYRYLLDLGLDSAIGCVNGGVLQAAYFGNTINSTLTANNTRNQLYYALANSTTSQISINNETVVQGNAGTFVANKVTIGSYGAPGFWGNFYTSEIVIYFSNRSSNRTGISENINDFYSLY
jgi:hypothetical protein